MNYLIIRATERQKKPPPRDVSSFCHWKDAKEIEGPFVGDVVVALCAFYRCRNTRIKFLFRSHSVLKKIQCYVLVHFECQMRQTKRN